MTVRFRRGGGIRFEEPRPKATRADLMDQALMQGGSLAAIAADLGITENYLRRHLKKRLDSGEWRFEPSETMVLAGHLIKKHQIVRHRRKAVGT